MKRSRSASLFVADPGGGGPGCLDPLVPEYEYN